MCSRRVLLRQSEQANVILKIAKTHCFEIELKSLLDVAYYLHNLYRSYIPMHDPPARRKIPRTVRLRKQSRCLPECSKAFTPGATLRKKAFRKVRVSNLRNLVAR
jgi:hypothetical protein